MAGGPVWPYSKFPATDELTYPLVYVGDGGVSAQEEGMGLAASHSSDASWQLRFAMPPSLPTGTAKLRVWAMADAVAGDEDIDPQWKSVAMGEDPSTGALNAEGNTNFLWTTAEDDIYKEGVITLDADTIVADEIVVMDLVWKAATSDLAAESCWFCYIFWE